MNLLKFSKLKFRMWFKYGLKLAIGQDGGRVQNVSHVVQVRAEGPKAPSPGHRPGYNGNQQCAL